MLGSNWDKRLVGGGNNGFITFSLVFKLGGLFNISVEGQYARGIIYFHILRVDFDRFEGRQSGGILSS